ncbi:MAG: DUF86 domain-containing protein [Nanoarchaeota archaeon]
MEQKRFRRYKEKLELIDLRKRELGEWLERSFEDDLTKLGSYKAFQEIVEAINDLLSMMLKDSSLLPEDDYSNIDKVIKNKLLPIELKNPLNELTGLRNRLIHEYNGLNEKLAKESMEKLLQSINKFLTFFEKWLQQKVKQ